MPTLLPWPIVTAKNCFATVRKHGIRAWPQISEPIPIVDFLNGASENERTDFERFSPKGYAVKHRNPHDGSTFDAFRVQAKDYAIVFALIEDMVPVTAEWKHGNNRITIVPVCGVPGKEEASLPNKKEKMLATAFREWKQETGTTLESAVPLSSSQGQGAFVRNVGGSCFPFLGTVKTPLVIGPTKFDDTEYLKMILFPLDEWLKLIESPELWDENPDFALEKCTVAVTYAALRKMGRLRLI